MWAWLTGAHADDKRNRSSITGSWESTTNVCEVADVKNHFSMKGLRVLHEQIKRFATIQSYELIELLRRLSEYMIFCDQHLPKNLILKDQLHNSDTSAAVQASAIFEYFGESNMLALLLELGNASLNVSIQTQLIQTLSILIQNINSRVLLFYILSNNFVNQLLQCPFAIMTDDDVRAWYVTLLKALSLRLDEETVQFFINQRQCPLYTQAMKFRGSSDTMISTAIKTIMLNFLHVKDPRVQNFVLIEQNFVYFGDLADKTTELALKIQGAINYQSQCGKSDTCIDEHIENYVNHLFYMQDLFNIQLPELGYRLGDMLYNRHIKNFLVMSMLPSCRPPPQRICTALAIYLLARWFDVFEHAPLLNAASFLLCATEPIRDWSYTIVALGAGASPSKSSSESNRKVQDASGIMFQPHSEEVCDSPLCYIQTRFQHGEWPVQEVRDCTFGTVHCVRGSLISLLTSKDQVLSSNAKLLILSIMNNKSIDRSLLKEMQLLPMQYGRRGQRRAVSQQDGNDQTEVLRKRTATVPSTSSTDFHHLPNAADCFSMMWLVNVVLCTLSEVSELSLRNLELSSRILIEVLCCGSQSHDTVCNFSKAQEEKLEKILASIARVIRDYMQATAADLDIFVQIFELEYAKYSSGSLTELLRIEVSPSSFISDFLAVIEPKHQLLASRAPHETLTSGFCMVDMRIRGSMRMFFILHKLCSEFLKLKKVKTKSFEPLMGFQYPITEELKTCNEFKRRIHMANHVFFQCSWREQMYQENADTMAFLLNAEALVLAILLRDKEDQDCAQIADHTSSCEGIVRVFAPISRCYSAQDVSDHCLLHITVSSDKAPIEDYTRQSKWKMHDDFRLWHLSICFHSADDCREAKAHMDLCRAKVRSYKLSRISDLLNACIDIAQSASDA